MAENCPLCKAPLVVWDQDPLSTTYICSECSYYFPPKQKVLGKVLRTGGAILGFAAVATGLAIKFLGSKDNGDEAGYEEDYE